MRNDMVEEKVSDSHGRAVEGGHGFIPLCEIVNYDDDVVMTSCRCWFAFHKIDGPFEKGDSFDDRVEGCHRCSHFR